MAFPPGILSHSTGLPNGTSFAFSHQYLGELGRLIIMDAGTARAHISAEIAPGDLSDQE